MQIKKPKILIIEDERIMREALAHKFTLSGFDVFKAEDGITGLEQAKANKPDFILLDIIMPNMNGLIMLKKLREYKWAKNLPVILLTNLSDPEAIIKKTKEYTATLNNSGLCEYLIKSECSFDYIVKRVIAKIHDQ